MKNAIQFWRFVTAYTVVFASIIALIFVQFRIHRVPQHEIPRMAGTYLFLQMAFTSLALLVGLRIGWFSRAYEKVFYLCLYATLVAAIILAFNLLKPLPRSGFYVAAMIAALVSAAIPYLAIDALKSASQNSEWIVKQVAVCGVYFFCGMVALLALFYPGGKILDILRLFFGLFWMTQAIYGFSSQMVVMRGRSEWIHQFDMVPALLAACLFICMGWQLGKGQIELSRQPASGFPLTVEEVVHSQPQEY